MKHESTGPARTRGLNVKTSLLACCAAAVFAIPASAQILPTAGVYDESNAVTFVAAGSTLDFNQFKTDVATAFTNDFGGVNQCNSIGGNAGPYNFSYGAGQTKVLNMTGGAHNDIGVTSSGKFVRAISGTGLWDSSKPEMTFFTETITSGVPDEAVVEFGLTILSTSAFSMGDVTARARFSDGTEATAQRAISEGPGLGDTFFGFRAPNGQSIVSVTVTNSAGRPMFIDDIGFITAARPYRAHVPR
jgi:hypothetical protein